MLNEYDIYMTFFSYICTQFHGSTKLTIIKTVQIDGIWQICGFRSRSSIFRILRKYGITSIIENTSNKGLPVEHGLSLCIEKNEGQNVLFDMGQSCLFARNARALSLSIADIDVAVVSHGHYDHGGSLSTFLAENPLMGRQIEYLLW